jgi:hypothetical protein
MDFIVAPARIVLTEQNAAPGASQQLKVLIQGCQGTGSPWFSRVSCDGDFSVHRKGRNPLQDATFNQPINTLPYRLAPGVAQRLSALSSTLPDGDLNTRASWSPVAPIPGIKVLRAPAHVAAPVALGERHHFIDRRASMRRLFEPPIDQPVDPASSKRSM